VMQYLGGDLDFFPADQIPNQPSRSPEEPPSSPARRLLSPGQFPCIHRHPTPSIPLQRPNPSAVLAGRAPWTTNKTALAQQQQLLLPGLLCARCGWLAPSPAVRSGGKEADLMRTRLQLQQRRRTGAVRPVPASTPYPLETR
jgi:hypothetical protein